ncbi:hypothetical protein [Kaistella daneshvariae]|uniref:hypothetical protein n=1 Tax=Kaistella daneshvariae TaxID=2487074 RepID=UPI0016073945|nr:hypothetical protein [Kaistella daneshvariae]
MIFPPEIILLKFVLQVIKLGFYKKYKNYPFSLRNQLSLANLGGGFGVVGNEPLDLRGFGETYGLEFLVQKRTVNNSYGIAAYIIGYSKFSNGEGNLLPSSWDSRHILALIAGKYFNRNWNLGARFRLQSGLPETPYDLQRSALVNIWNISNGPLQDYTQLNSQPGNLTHQLDLRPEKKWIFSKWQFTAYIDVVNAYGSKSPSRLPVVNSVMLITMASSPIRKRHKMSSFIYCKPVKMMVRRRCHILVLSSNFRKKEKFAAL